MDLGSYESMFHPYAQWMLANHQSGLPPVLLNAAPGPSGSSHTGRPSHTSARSKQRADHSPDGDQPAKSRSVMTIIDHPMDTEDTLSTMIPFGPRQLYKIPAAERLDLLLVLREQLAFEQKEAFQA